MSVDIYKIKMANNLLQYIQFRTYVKRNLQPEDGVVGCKSLDE
jgi:hypothetical protein